MCQNELHFRSYILLFLHRYGDMYPITAIGRVLACLCALFGAATTGMLVSVLVDRYQRIYNRKKFFPEQILSSGDSNESEHIEKEDFIRKKLSGLKKSESNKPTAFPTLSSHPRISVYHHRREEQQRQHQQKKQRPSQQQSCTVSSLSHARFIISFVVQKGKKKSASPMIRELIEELTAAIAKSGSQMHLQLIANDIVQ